MLLIKNSLYLREKRIRTIRKAFAEVAETVADADSNAYAPCRGRCPQQGAQINYGRPTST